MSVTRRTTVAAVRAWTRLYTLGLSPQLRAERLAEIESDLWESQHAAGRASGAQIAARLLCGVFADVAWRLETGGIMSVRMISLALGGALVVTFLLVATLLLSATPPAPPPAPAAGRPVKTYPLPPPPPPPPCNPPYMKQFAPCSKLGSF